MSHVKQEALFLDLTKIQSPRARKHLKKLYDGFLAEERQPRKPNEQNLCTVCEVAPRRVGYCHCECCQRFKQAVDREIQPPDRVRLTTMERQKIIKTLTHKFKRECERKSTAGNPVVIGFEYPPEYFRLNRRSEFIAMFDPSNVRIFSTQARWRAYRKSRAGEIRERQRDFRQWNRRLKRQKRAETSLL